MQLKITINRSKMSYNVDVLCPNLCRLGEGPCWDAPNQRLLFVDIEKSTVHRWNYSTLSLQAPLKLNGPYVSAVVPRENGGFVVAAYDRFASLNEVTGLSSTIAKVPLNEQVKFNDGKCDPAGRFWAGTGGTTNETKQGYLYTLNTDKTVTTKISDVILSNGLSWSPDHTKMYFIDTPTYNVLAYDYDVNTGAIANPQLLLKFDKWKDGTPDGQCNDAKGNLWVAMYGGGRVIKVDASTGQKVERISVSTSALKITSCCFGGPDLNELFVTSASSDEPVGDAGSLFKVTGLQAKGRLSTPYKG
ncbi:regucalcin-like [Styela clava]